MTIKKNDGDPSPQKWAEFRFSVIGHLLASPPEPGELKKCLEYLHAKTWQHPISGEPIRVGLSTIERWYYQVRDQQDPLLELRRKIRHDANQMPSIVAEVAQLITNQYKDHPSWSYRLQTDNLVALVENKRLSCQIPSYSTVKRYMKKQGLFRRKKSRNQLRPAAIKAFERSMKRETRLFESLYTGSLWHLDFHSGSKQILGKDGQWHTPMCLCIIDDYSRLACHIQWFLNENTDCLVHGFIQALQKRGLPRELMTDNGSAMKSSEFTSGLSRLGIVWSPTMEYSPNQNGKQEVFWSSLEGRLVAMLENVPDLSLKLLNDATISWVEMEYNRSKHSEIKEAPINRYLSKNDVSRHCPELEKLNDAFTYSAHRTQRRSDGTIQLEGCRYEIPSRYRHLEIIHLRYPRWEPSLVFMVDPKRQDKICKIYPVDLKKNAQGQRSFHSQNSNIDNTQPRSTEIAPLLQKLMADYAATGLPPAYIPKHEQSEK